ncbi:uncharacterized protein VTP21DRAFT_2608 [Calcarisporiella thermophila]|uniref:uncharacterized protein n=1 Tax=Calcarisporiella thermophila TaxID=911321 RepID=UPI0037431024
MKAMEKQRILTISTRAIQARANWLLQQPGLCTGERGEATVLLESGEVQWTYTARRQDSDWLVALNLQLAERLFHGAPRSHLPDLWEAAVSANKLDQAVGSAPPASEAADVQEDAGGFMLQHEPGSVLIETWVKTEVVPHCVKSLPDLQLLMAARPWDSKSVVKPWPKATECPYEYLDSGALKIAIGDASLILGRSCGGGRILSGYSCIHGELTGRAMIDHLLCGGVQPVYLLEHHSTTWRVVAEHLALDTGLSIYLKHTGECSACATKRAAEQGIWLVVDPSDDQEAVLTPDSRAGTDSTPLRQHASVQPCIKSKVNWLRALPANLDRAAPTPAHESVLLVVACATRKYYVALPA